MLRAERLGTGIAILRATLNRTQNGTRAIAYDNSTISRYYTLGMTMRGGFITSKMFSPSRRCYRFFGAQIEAQTRADLELYPLSSRRDFTAMLVQPLAWHLRNDGGEKVRYNGRRGNIARVIARSEIRGRVRRKFAWINCSDPRIVATLRLFSYRRRSLKAVALRAFPHRAVLRKNSLLNLWLMIAESSTTLHTHVYIYAYRY